MIPRRVGWATLLAFLLHGILIVTGQYTHSFDAYIHQFFADHYRLDWWTLWEPRWYTGFSVVSYPPLVHQLIALLSHLTGLEAAFAAILWAALTVYPLAVYAFSRVFFGRSISGYAAVGAAMAPSLFLAAHVFGQIPTVVATLGALFGIAALADFLRKGGWLNGSLALALFTVVMAAHHATLMFLPWVVAGLTLHILLNEKVNKRQLFTRLAIFTPLAVFFGLGVIWPFWDWGRGQQIQVPIDHPTRHNYLTDSFAFVTFFLPAYGPLLVLIPLALGLGLRKRYSGLTLAFLPLFILGLGDTTPLPRLLFGKGWEWLIYDRFAFWAALLLLPFVGVAIVLVKRKIWRTAKHAKNAKEDQEPVKNAELSYFSRTGISGFSSRTWRAWRFDKIFTIVQKHYNIKIKQPRKLIAPVYFIVMGIVAALIGFGPTLVPFEPARVEMQPIVDFLAQGDHAQWRYLTFGFGDQLARLSTLTRATTIDGDYHTARNLPELRSSGIGQIDTVFWMKDGLNKLDPILQKSGGRGVRWGFVDLPLYIPVLQRNGWVKLRTLENGVEVWENPSATLPPPVQIPPQNPLAAFSWGVFPLLSLVVTGVLSFVRLRKR